MDGLKKARASKRRVFSVALNALKAEYNSSTKTAESIEVHLNLLEDKESKLEAVHAEILQLLQNDPDCTEEEYDEEYAEIEEYRDRFIKWSTKAKNYVMEGKSSQE